VFFSNLSRLQSTVAASGIISIWNRHPVANPIDLMDGLLGVSWPKYAKGPDLRPLVFLRLKIQATIFRL